MLKPTVNEAQIFKTLAYQYPQFVEYLSRCRQHELDQIPYAKDNTCVMQGRAQALTEMQKLFPDPV